MPGSLPFKALRRVRRWYAAPVIGAEAAGSAAARPRVYLAPLASRSDAKILSASLAAAGMPPPSWLPRDGAQVDEDQVRAAFLAGEPVLVPVSPPRRGPDRLARLLAWVQQAGIDADLIPVEVLWGPAENRPQIRKLILGNPFSPPEWLRWLHVRRRGSCRVIVAAPGTRSSLESEASVGSDSLALSAFVRSQAIKALSKKEREILGDRFKVPRLLVEQLVAEADFQDRVAAAGASIGLTRAESLAEAEHGLRELATGHRRLSMELFSRISGWFYRLAFQPEIGVDAKQLGRLRELGRRCPLVFVPSHQSNMDHPVLYNALFTSGFPPPFTAAGINMSFWPMSRILPGTGAFFIRRSVGEDPVYREALRGFVNYLVQRRFHIEFFIEGGRTRSGKLLPPRYGMLRYIVDSAREHGIDDVLIVPTSLTYDQVLEAGEYVRQQLGEDKERESLRFLLRQIGKARRTRLGTIHLRFSQPISLRDHLQERGNDRLVLEKLAFRICTQINAARPLVPVSSLCSILLGSGSRALTVGELERETQRVIEYAHERDIVLAEELASGARAAVDAALLALAKTGVVQDYREGHEPVYFVPERRRHIASYYRNSVVHFFLGRAIAALAEQVAGDEAPEKAEHWALRLRELLKFEFFFSDRDAFLEEIAQERAILATERSRGIESFAAADPSVVGDFLESYWVVTETLAAPQISGTALREAELLRRCHALGRQRLLQQQVRRPELLSSVTFANALQLLENLGAGERTPDGFVCGSPDRLGVLARDLQRLNALSRT
jgi:glycerol-3-phosphate O-acyltransferase